MRRTQIAGALPYVGEMSDRFSFTQSRRWVVLFLALLLAIAGVILVNNTNHLDELGIALVIIAVIGAWITTPPRVRS